MTMIKINAIIKIKKSSISSYLVFYKKGIIVTQNKKICRFLVNFLFVIIFLSDIWYNLKILIIQ